LVECGAAQSRHVVYQKAGAKWLSSLGHVRISVPNMSHAKDVR
jgi:hypothetical protein